MAKNIKRGRGRPGNPVKVGAIVYRNLQAAVTATQKRKPDAPGYITVYQRLAAGMPLNEALFTPARKYVKREAVAA